MIKVYAGKIYDTEKATMIATYIDQPQIGAAIVTKLYATASGRFFTTMHCLDCEDSQLSVLQAEEAMDWARRCKCSDETMIRYFRELLTDA